MRLLIDTNVYAQLGKGNTHMRSLVQSADEIVVSSIVLGELHAGFGLGSKRAKNIKELDEFLRQPGVKIVAPDKIIAERYGELIRVLKKNGTPIPTNDVWIAATALETAGRMLSFDTHFGIVPGLFNIIS